MPFYFFKPQKTKESENSFFFQNKKGFTLIEILVVIAIIGIISAVAIFNHRGFQDRLELSNDAQMVVSMVREARVTALSVREAQVGDFGDRFERGYGLHFSSEPEDQTSFVYFVDLDNNDQYSATQPTTVCTHPECFRPIQLQGGNRVVEVCKIIGGGVEFCHNQVTSVSVVFKRPSTHATLSFNHSAGVPASTVLIRIESPQGRQLSVIIEETGLSFVR